MSIEHSAESDSRKKVVSHSDENLVSCGNDSVNIIISLKWCKGCGICIEYCPKNVLEFKNAKAVVARVDDCIKCELCENMCPDFAITVDKLEEKK